MLLHAERLGELVHFPDEGGHRIAAAAAAGVDFPAHVIGDGEGGEIVRAEQRGVERVAQGELVAGLEVHRIRPADEGDRLGHGDDGGAEIGAGGGRPVHGDDGGGDFGEAGDGAFVGGIGGDQDFPGVGLHHDHAFGRLGGCREGEH